MVFIIWEGMLVLGLLFRFKKNSGGIEPEEMELQLSYVFYDYINPQQ